MKEGDARCQRKCFTFHSPNLEVSPVDECYGGCPRVGRNVERKGCWVWGAGCGVLGVGCWVWGEGYGVLGVGCWVWGAG